MRISTARQSSGPSQRLELQHHESAVWSRMYGQSDSLATVLPRVMTTGATSYYSNMEGTSTT
ncbi:hypothetical protein [Enterobacter phage 04_vB_Eclo_IJM]|nr:hypothetical protein [Enterobacter phage 04_vB_Eclo_IJM]